MKKCPECDEKMAYVSPTRMGYEYGCHVFSQDYHEHWWCVDCAVEEAILPDDTNDEIE